MAENSNVKNNNTQINRENSVTNVAEDYLQLVTTITASLQCVIFSHNLHRAQQAAQKINLS
jgi:hypothetical protein